LIAREVAAVAEEGLVTESESCTTPAIAVVPVATEMVGLVPEVMLRGNVPEMLCSAEPEDIELILPCASTVREGLA
jgi:hypothetical protein